MIQRIQSFLLVLAATAAVLMFRFPIATYVAESESQSYLLNARLDLIPRATDMGQQVASMVDVDMAQAGYINMWPLLVLTVVVIALSLVSIFLYKNRILQMRVVAVAFLLDVVSVFVIFIWAVDAYAKQVTLFANTLNLSNVHTVYSVSTYLAIVVGVLLFFAQRAIRRDEMKVRAADRLR